MAQHQNVLDSTAVLMRVREQRQALATHMVPQVLRAAISPDERRSMLRVYSDDLHNLMQSTQAIARGLEERQRRDNRVYPSLQAWSRLWSAVQQVKEALLRQVQCSNPEPNPARVDRIVCLINDLNAASNDPSLL